MASFSVGDSGAVRQTTILMRMHEVSPDCPYAFEEASTLRLPEAAAVACCNSLLQ